jgi:YHS domain-containing protein
MIELFEVRSDAAELGPKVVDPVCGMELRPGEIVARLRLGDLEHHFCSDKHLQRFVANPAAYTRGTDSSVESHVELDS